MNRRIIGTIVIIIVVALLLSIAYFLYINKDTLSGISAPNNNSSQPIDNTANIPVNTGSANHDPVKTVTIEESSPVTDTQTPSARSDKQNLMRLASLFAERFGSYSNQSNFSNISDLKMFMSARMKVWAESYVAGQRALKLDQSIYYGITTKAISSEINEYDDDIGRCDILVKTRRREATNTTDNTSDIFDQNVVVHFIRENGAWKVDSANWLDKN